MYPLHKNLRIIFLIILLVGVGCRSAQGHKTSSLSDDQVRASLPLSSAVFDSSLLRFTPHEGNTPGTAYLVQDLPYPPVAALRQKLEAELPYAIKNRGEAHITVITPPEYDQALKDHLSISAINEMAQEAKILSLPFEPVCVGEASAVLGDRRETTYFIVVRSEPLLQLRRKIAAAFQANGGEPEAFDPEHYDPHITLGFTKRDLFEQDGIRKNSQSCRQGVYLVNER